MALVRDRKSEMRLELTFAPIDGARSYRLIYRHALPVNLQLMSDAYYAELASNVTNATRRRVHTREPQGPTGSIDVTRLDGPRGVDLLSFRWHAGPPLAGRSAVFWVQDSAAPDEIRCLTADDNAASPRLLSALPRRTPASGLRRSPAHDARDNRTDGAETEVISRCFLFDEPPGAGGVGSFTVSPFALVSPQPVDWGGAATRVWSTLGDACETLPSTSDILVFASACESEPSGAVSCDFTATSETVLIRTSCDGSVKQLHLSSRETALAPSGCVRAARFEASAHLCSEVFHASLPPPPPPLL